MALKHYKHTRKYRLWSQNRTYGCCLPPQSVTVALGDTFLHYGEASGVNFSQLVNLKSNQCQH